MSIFGLFLVPTASQYKEYSTIIKTFSKKYNTPEFDPHVTIFWLQDVSENDLLTKIKEVIKGFNEIEIELLGINFSNTFFKCVFAQIKMSTELLDLYQKLEAGLQYTSKSSYFPHMSLIYGDFSPEEKSNIADQMKIEKILILDKLIIVKKGRSPSEFIQVSELKLN